MSRPPLRIKGSVVVDRPLEQVFAYVADPTTHVNWQSQLHHVHYKPAEVVGTGTITEVRKIMGRQVSHTIEVVEHVENSHFKHRGTATSHEGELERSYLFTALGDDRTEVAVELELDTHGILKSGQPIMERMLQRELNSNLLHLKDILEAHQDLHEGIKDLPVHGKS